eukprot:gb/GEZN01003483.1/.p1 GENE.gb/GEZN01003483.1/~~gb/GEZN01003483.1/.p1  ORF type:complete len:671 (-),score=91.32 gb/GEZN01003483.1/:63-2075(-)
MLRLYGRAALRTTLPRQHLLLPLSARRSYSDHPVSVRVHHILRRVRSDPKPTWNQLSNDLRDLMNALASTEGYASQSAGSGGYGQTQTSNVAMFLRTPPEVLYYTRGFNAGKAAMSLAFIGFVIYLVVTSRDRGMVDLQALSGMSDQFEEYDSMGRPIRAKGELPPKRTTLNDVIGCEEAKTELQDVVDYLRNPHKYEEMGCEMPKGILMIGPPGVGKTLMARALAGEAGVPYLVTDGASFDQVFVGIGTLRVQKLFERARQIAPCIIFIDEIDAVGSKRDEPMNVRRNTLNQLLVEMDGFKGNEGILVMGATNLPDILDSALLRPGRFDRTVQVDPPDRAARTELIKYYLKNRAGVCVDTKTLDALAGSTAGLTGADIKNLVNLAAIEAVQKGDINITANHLAEAVEVVRMGRKNEHLEINEETRKLTAYHEAGHAILSLYTEGSDPIYKATLVPRGGALGMVSNTPTDEHLISKQKLSAFMDMAMGGRAAEELIFGKDYITQGAGNDFMKATQIARQMVTQYGMSEKVGKVWYSERDLALELSPETQDLIDHEIQQILQTSYDRATRVLKERKVEHDLLAKALLTHDTLDAEEIKQLIGFDPKLKTQPSMCDGQATFIPKLPSRVPVSTGSPRTEPTKKTDPAGDNLKKPMHKPLPNLSPTLATDTGN